MSGESAPRMFVPGAAAAAGLAHLEAGRLTEAAEELETAVFYDEADSDSLHLLGLITAEQGDFYGGIKKIQEAIGINPQRAAYHNTLGQVYWRMGRPEEAMAACKEAVALRPDLAEVQNGLATILLSSGRNDEAITHYRLATECAPEAPDLWYNLGNALTTVGSSPEIETCYRNAIRFNRNFARAFGNYARWLMTQSRWMEADIVAAEAVRLGPEEASHWNSQGVVWLEKGWGDSESCFRAAIAREPQNAGTYYNLGRSLFEQGRSDEAIDAYQAALRINPKFGAAEVAACMSQLPILYRTEEEIVQRRIRYTRALESLAAVDPIVLADGIGTAQPFFLPYQGADDWSLQSIYGRMACLVLDETESPVTLAQPPAPGERIRIGIVSGFFCDHTLFKLFIEGWLTQIDRSRFEVIGFHTGREIDALTAQCDRWCDRFVCGLPSNAAWRQVIAESNSHVLLYPEVGIDPVAGRLAAMRLAPVQCAAWGQPETTGMPTIDYFLSSDLMEPADGHEFYTERLIRLPNLGMHYKPVAWTRLPRARRGRLGLRRDVPVFWSGQAIYKYHPGYDSIFTRIAAELDGCQFVFIEFPKSKVLTEVFRTRLTAAFASAGLNSEERIIIMPQMSQQDYLDTVSLTDVILDTPGWSGGKSTMDCLACDPAIVTMPGQFMRGRHTAAILRQIGCAETIAGSEDEYVSIAVRLARDAAWRAQVRQGVAAGKHKAFGDTAYIRALEDFLTDKVIPGFADRRQGATVTPE